MPEPRLPQLHPDLVACLEGEKLRHPLVSCDHALPAWYPRLNRLYRVRLQQERGEYTPNDWDLLRPDLSPEERLTYVVSGNWPPSDDPDYYRLAGQIWTAPDLMLNSSGVFESLVVPTHGHVSHLMTDQERERLAELPESLTVYRGFGPFFNHGYSWTLDRNIAALWAPALGPNNPRVWVARAEKSKVIAYFDRRDEDEIMISTADVVDLREESI